MCIRDRAKEIWFEPAAGWKAIATAPNTQCLRWRKRKDSSPPIDYVFHKQDLYSWSKAKTIRHQVRQAESEQAGSDSWTENIHIKKEIRKERTIPSRFQPELGPQDVFSGFIHPFRKIRFRHRAVRMVRFARFTRLGFRNQGSAKFRPHSSVS